MSRNYSRWLKAYGDYTTLSEAPREFHFWVGVSTIGGALRRRVWIDQIHFQWTPNFYIVFVGPAGIVTKSTTMRAGIKLLRQVEGIHMGPQSMTWQALTVALEEAREDVPHGEDFLPMCPVTCDVSELGTFLRPDDNELVDVLTDLWDGQLVEWERKTKTQGTTTLVNPWINVIGCTTPTWIKGNFREEMIGGGLTSRCIFVYGDKKSTYIPYISEMVNRDSHLEMEKKLVEDLQEIATITGEMVMTPEAIAWGTAWYEDHWSHRPTRLASDRFNGYIARKQTHIHKLAIVLSAAERSDRVITMEHLVMADSMMTAAETNMIKVFEMIGAAPSSRQMEELVSFVRINKVMLKGDLWKVCYRNMSGKEFSEAIDAAIMADEIKAVTHPQGAAYQYVGKGQVQTIPPEEETKVAEVK